MNIKIYEGKLLDCIKNCLKDGRFPATIEQIKELKEKGLVKEKWYDTSTISYKGEKRTATLEELKNIENVWKDGGRLWYVNGRDDDSYAGGDDDLSDGSGRLVGISQTKNNKEVCSKCGK